MHAPSVSIGLPVYNGAEFLAQALESILAQTYADFEVVISDNASTDATPAIISDYARRDQRIRCFRQPANMGVGNNDSFVAKHARGTWLKWAAANDEYAPTLLEDCLGPLQRDPGVVLCHGRTQFVDMAGNPGEIYDGDFEALSENPLERYRIARERLHLGTSIQAGVVRLDAARRCGFMGNYRDSDRVLVFGLALLGKFVLLPQVHLYRRWGESVATPLRTPLEVERLYRPDSTRPPLFVNLPRQVSQLEIALRVPYGWRAKGCALLGVVRYTDWKRKLLRRPSHNTSTRGIAGGY